MARPVCSADHLGRFRIVVLRIDPDLRTIPHHDLVAAVPSYVEHSITHVRMTVIGEPSYSPAPAVEHTSLVDIG